MSIAKTGLYGKKIKKKPGDLTAGAGGTTFWVGLVVVSLALLSGLATYLILTGLTAIVPTHEVVVTVLLINSLLIVAMIGVIAWQIWGLWVARREEKAGARLHIKIVGLFSVIAILPAILLAIFASVSLDRGLDHWFSARTKSIIFDSGNIAKAYINEHGQIIRSDVLAMARDINDAAKDAQKNPIRFKALLVAQASLRDLPMVFLIDGQGKIIETAANRLKVGYSTPSKGALKSMRDKKTVIITPNSQSRRVGAITIVDKLTDTYLYAARPVNPEVIRHLERTQAGMAEYGRLEERRTGVQVAFALMYVTIALTLLLAAVWTGFWFASRLVAPIRRLIGASDQVSKGNLNIQVAIRQGEGDLHKLSTTFNRMTTVLKEQRFELVSTNEQLTERRRFTEAVLSGVTAGVIGLDMKGHVTIANPSAVELLGIARTDLIDRKLIEVVPEMNELLTQVNVEARKNRFHDQIHLYVNEIERTFAVQITRERGSDKDYGIVVTFDDISELVAAQRNTAWSDVARRIAHEIKNPLTPIQLSAERIRRKYGKVIPDDDREVFDKCTDTIVRQVGDIGRMVDEFSDFARMPKPNMELQDMRETVRETVFLFQVANSEIIFENELPDDPVIQSYDRRLISQALTNLVKNASEAIGGAKESSDNPDAYDGHILTRLSTDEGQVIIEVIDNGCGLPRKDRRRLVEPYITTRQKGTGLGLAIVRKIVEQHSGKLELKDAAPKNGSKNGASISMIMPATNLSREDAPAASGSGTDTSDAGNDNSNNHQINDVQGVKNAI